VVGKITKFLGQVIDPRPPKDITHDKTKKHKVNGIVDDGLSKAKESKLRAEYLYFEVEVEKLESEYPEDGDRVRKWVRVPRVMEGF
jgi:hypothetical protein